MNNTLTYKLGKWKTVAERIKTYVAWSSFIMVTYLFVIESPLGINPYIWLVMICSAMAFLGWVDVNKGIFESQNDYTWMKVPTWVNHVKQTKEMMQRLEKIEKKVKEREK